MPLYTCKLNIFKSCTNDDHWRSQAGASSNPTSMCLDSQLQELQLIQHSLLPGESFSFVLPPDDSRIWTSLLHSYNTTPSTIPSLPSPVPQVKFQVKATDARIFFEVQFPERYPEDSDVDIAQVPLVSVNGEGMSRDEHHQWRAFVQERLAEVRGNE